MLCVFLLHMRSLVRIGDDHPRLTLLKNHQPLLLLLNTPFSHPLPKCQSRYPTSTLLFFFFFAQLYHLMRFTLSKVFSFCCTNTFSFSIIITQIERNRNCLYIYTHSTVRVVSFLHVRVHAAGGMFSENCAKEQEYVCIRVKRRHRMHDPLLQAHIKGGRFISEISHIIIFNDPCSHQGSQKNPPLGLP